NLVYNAVQATGEGGTISLSTSLDEDGGLVVVSVQDTGCGIDPEHLPYLFDPFFTTHKHGSGLGLAICHEIVQGHGGRITVSSTPGQGSTFRVYLPVAGGA
ncbi:MAG TPA: ATP-binding protein, partial [Spirochaetia bacterium]|nr:ATP-binding protein [Spirochaetia bacterium]